MMNNNSSKGMCQAPCYHKPFPLFGLLQLPESIWHRCMLPGDAEPDYTISLALQLPLAF